MNLKKAKWKKFGFEFFSIFIAVISAFALNNWNDNRRDSLAESKIIAEIYNGLQNDLTDVHVNQIGHKQGIRACQYLNDMIQGKPVITDSISYHFHNLTRDFISIQNISGYETLKSRGLELLKNDDLRASIISLYEYDFNSLRKLEEEYAEMQFHSSYFPHLNKLIAPSLIFDEQGNIISIKTPLKISDDDKRILLSNIWKISGNRAFILKYYTTIENKIHSVLKQIDNLKKR